LGAFVPSAPALSNDALSLLVEEEPLEILQLSLLWSKVTNSAVARIHHSIPVFRNARRALVHASTQANLVVCSAAARHSLQGEWGDAGLDAFVSFIAGQEFGPKATQIQKIGAMAGFPKTKILMMGDAPGDMKAAHQAGVRFYPIVPGDEEKSWEDFLKIVLPAFVEEAYNEELENQFLRKFQSTLKPLRYADGLASLGVAVPA
jgi:phosphoglycolate phosphatase-like HAD superfamily hydrolase